MKKLNFQILMIVCHLISISTAQDILSITGIAGAVGKSVTSDLSNNMIQAGEFSGQISIGSILLTSSGSSDIYLSKSNSAGTVLWAIKFGSPGSDANFGLDTDIDGNIYITGYYSSLLSIGNTTLSNYGAEDAYIAKFNPQGELLWAKRAGGSSPDHGRGIAVDANGNAYVVGYFHNSAMFEQTQLTGVNADIFLAKYNTLGELVWVKQASGSAYEGGYGVAIDQAGNIFITGDYAASVSFDQHIITAIGGDDVFIAKYNSSGVCQWVRSFGGGGYEIGLGATCDIEGNVYITGYTYSLTFVVGSLTMNRTGENDPFVVKYSAVGDAVWAKLFTGSSSGSAYSISFGGKSHLTVTGHYSSEMNFGEQTITSFGGSDGFNTILDLDGTCLWAQSWGGAGEDIPPYSAKIGDIGFLYTGTFSGSAFFGTNQLHNGGSYLIRMTDNFTSPSPISSNFESEINIIASTSSVRDNENYAGVDSLATEDYDPSLDTPNPPIPPGNYIDAYFYHPEWNSPLGSKFASDVKQSTDLADTVKRWFFEVETNVLDDTVKLQFTQENVATKFGKYLTDMQTGQRIDLRYTDIYKYYNTSSSPRKFMLIVGDSTAPQIANLIPKGDEIWRSYTQKTVSWTMSDGTGIDSVFLYASNNNGTNYARFASIGNTSSYNWTIPQEYLNNGYRVKTIVRDSLGNESEIISPLAFTVVGDSLQTQSFAGWNLTGTPLSPNDTTLTGILGDDIVSSPYFVWGYTLATGYTLPLGMTFGTGYWLGLLNNHSWDVRGTAVESDSTGQSLNLGYNLISTKYVREVSKDRMSFVKAGTGYNFNQAVTSGLISNAIFGYNGSGYTEEDTLSLFGGYWLGVLQEGVILYQKPVSTQLPLSKGNKEPELFTENNWKLRLNAESGTHSDNITEIGVTETATAGYDTECDAARPPVPPVDKFIEIYSEVSGTGYPQFLGNRYARDFKNTPNWTIKVKKGNTGSNEVTINWNRNELGNLPDGMRITMTDLITGQTIDMRRDSSYSFTYSEERTFLINGTATGIEDAITAPTDFSLSQNYPNPFNPSTKIRYSIPEESRVKITIYNSLGEMVKILTNETAQRGWYETTFDATQIPSGIYFAKIEAQSTGSSKQFTQTIKMLLIK